MTHKFNSLIHDLAVCKKLCKHSNFWFVTYTYWTLADPRVVKDEHLENQKCYLNLNKIFDLLNVHPFSPRSFFTFLVAVVHGAARRGRTKHAD